MDATVQKRIDRIKELLAKGAKMTAAEQAELKKLMAEQTEWEKKNPDEASALKAASTIAAKSPEQQKAEFEAARAEAAAAETDRQKAAAVAAAKKAGAPGAAVEAAKSAVPPVSPENMQVNPDLPRLDTGAPATVPAPTEEIQYDANGWYYDAKTGKWLPGPDAKYAEPVTTTAPGTEAPATDERGYGDKAREFEAAMAAGEQPAPDVVPVPVGEVPKKRSFGDTLKELGTKYGVPMLEILEAVGKQRGGITTPTQLDKKYQEKIEQQQREYMANLEREKEAREEATYQKRIAAERAWQEQQAALTRAAETAARREELTARQKLAQMQIDAARAAGKTGGSASVIPE